MGQHSHSCRVHSHCSNTKGPHQDRLQLQHLSSFFHSSPSSQHCGQHSHSDLVQVHNMDSSLHSNHRCRGSQHCSIAKDRPQDQLQRLVQHWLPSSLDYPWQQQQMLYQQEFHGDHMFCDSPM